MKTRNEQERLQLAAEALKKRSAATKEHAAAGGSPKCQHCGRGTLEPATPTLTLERGGAVLVFQRVPAKVCQTCGDKLVDEQTTAILLGLSEKALGDGVQFQVRRYPGKTRRGDDLYGLWAGMGIDLSKADLAEARREAWSMSPRYKRSPKGRQ